MLDGSKGKLFVSSFIVIAALFLGRGSISLHIHEVE